MLPTPDERFAAMQLERASNRERAARYRRQQRYRAAIILGFELVLGAATVLPVAFHWPGWVAENIVAAIGLGIFNVYLVIAGGRN